MPLRESLERSGLWLFRRRSYLPLLLFPLVASVMPESASGDGDSMRGRLLGGLCLLVSLSGLAIRAWVVGTTPAGTSGRNTHAQVAESLNTTGLYSVMRHPLYAGNYLMWLGVALFPGVWWLVVVVSLAFWLYYERIMFAEEEFLRCRFGADFEAWAARTPTFIPNLREWIPPSLPFSWRNVLRREYSGLYGLIASFTLLELIAEIRAHGALGLDPVWGALFGATTIVYLTLLTLKHHTRLLTVPGR